MRDEILNSARNGVFVAIVLFILSAIPIDIATREVGTCEFIFPQTASGTMQPKYDCDSEKELFTKSLNGQTYSFEAYAFQVLVSDIRQPFASIFELDSNILQRKICLYDTPSTANIGFITEVEIDTNNSIFDVRDYGDLSADKKCLFIDPNKWKTITTKFVPIPIETGVDESTLDRLCEDPNLKVLVIIKYEFVFGGFAVMSILFFYFAFVAGALTALFSIINHLKEIRELLSKIRFTRRGW